MAYNKLQTMRGNIEAIRTAFLLDVERRKPTQEEWKLSVLYPDGRPADAELLAMMYDASLDRFYTHDLFFRVNFTRNIPHSLWNKWYTPSIINPRNSSAG